MKNNILEVESDSVHVLLSHHTFFGDQLEGSLEGVLDFVQVIHLLGQIKKQVDATSVWTEALDYFGIIWVPCVVIGHLSVVKLGWGLA